MRVGLARVRGRSMEPTLRAGDRLVLRYGVPVRPGDLVVVRLPDRGTAVKRAWRRDGRGPDGSASDGPAPDDPSPDVPAWWVERDNAAAGVDSWLLGAVPERDILAVVIGRWWPRPSLLRGRCARG